MNSLTKLALAAVLLTTAAGAQAQIVNGYFRNNGTYVAPHYRTPANGIVYDNLSYRGYPSQQPGYISPRSYGFESGLDSGYSRPRPMPSYGEYGSGFQTLPNTGRTYRTSIYGY